MARGSGISPRRSQSNRRSRGGRGRERQTSRPSTRPSREPGPGPAVTPPSSPVTRPIPLKEESSESVFQSESSTICSDVDGETHADASPPRSSSCRHTPTTMAPPLTSTRNYKVIRQDWSKKIGLILTNNRDNSEDCFKALRHIKRFKTQLKREVRELKSKIYRNEQKELERMEREVEEQKRRIEEEREALRREALVYATQEDDLLQKIKAKKNELDESTPERLLPPSFTVLNPSPSSVTSTTPIRSRVARDDYKTIRAMEVVDSDDSEKADPYADISRPSNAPASPASASHCLRHLFAHPPRSHVHDHGVEGSSECIICYGQLDGVIASPSHCGHKFCAECIVSWMHSLSQKASSLTCPLCRESFDSLKLGEHIKGKKDRLLTTLDVWDDKTGQLKAAELAKPENRKTNLFILPIAAEKPLSASDDEDSAAQPCGICGLSDEYEKLCCDHCNKIFHMPCVGLRGPPGGRPLIPRGNWFCDDCWGPGDGSELFATRLARMPPQTDAQRERLFEKFMNDRREYYRMKHKELKVELLRNSHIPKSPRREGPILRIRNQPHRRRRGIDLRDLGLS